MKRVNLNYCLPLLLMLLAFTSCSRKYRIEGKSSITSLDGKILFLKAFQADGQWVTIDSAEVLHGLFSMEGAVDSAMLVTLFLNDESILPMVLEKGKVDVTISGTQLTARGTPLNNALYDFIDKRNALEIQIEELQRKEARMVLDGANLDDIHSQLAEEGDALAKEMDDYVKAFITKNFETPLGSGVFMIMCSSMPYPLMTPEIEDIMRIAPQTFKENVFVKDFLTKAKQNMQLIEEHNRLLQNREITAQR